MTRRLRNSPKPSTNVTRNQSEKQIRVVAEEYEYFLNPVELWWRDKYEWLEECGYKLRERYTHKWKPSWMKVGCIDRHEDGFGVPEDSKTMDAIRISDEASVTLKIVNEERHPREADTALFLSSGLLASDPRNHCAPVWEVLEVPHNHALCIIVMPLLRPCEDPEIWTLGEVAELLRQMIEGVEFMHEHDVAHLNPSASDFMYNPIRMYPHGYHRVITNMCPDLRHKATHYTRTERPPKYYFTDFCISKRYKDSDGDAAFDQVVRWKNNFAPEYKRPEIPCDQFALDVYLLGDVIRSQFLSRYNKLSWMKPLVDEMCREDPSTRPMMADVMTRYEWMISSMSDTRLAARLVPKKENGAVRIWKNYRYIAKSRKRQLSSISPVPAEFFCMKMCL